MQTEILKAKDIVYKVEGFCLLIKDFSIKKGEKICLFGPNGSGKTTLARLLNGYLKPEKGTVNLYGRPLEEWPHSKRTLKLTYCAFDPLLAASGKKLFDFVKMGAHHRSEPGIESEIKSLLTDFGLAGKESQPIDTLSSGELQKAIIVQTLLQHSRIIFFDEPTAHLDIYWQTAVLKNIFNHAAAFQDAIVTILHDLNLALNYFDRVICLAGGTVAFDFKLSDTRSKIAAARAIGELYGVKLKVLQVKEKVIAVYF